MDSQRIVAVEWAHLEGRCPRKAGSNARLGEHGSAIRVPILRITTADGVSGFGACYAGPERAVALLDLHLRDLFKAGRSRTVPRSFLWIVL
jgi:hypothetical protein